MSATMPWEDTNARFVDRVWKTVWSATSDPVGTFGRLGDVAGEPDIGAAARFALVVSVVGWAPLLLVAPCLAALPFAFAAALPDPLRGVGLGAMCAAAGFLPFAFIAASIGVELLHGAVFHMVARVLGGVGTLSASMHAMLYTSAIRFWLCPALFLAFVPFLGGMIHMAVRGGFIVWTGVACYGAARGIHELDDTRGIVAAILTPLVSMSVVVGIAFACALAFVALFAGSVSLHDLFEAGTR